MRRYVGPIAETERDPAPVSEGGNLPPTVAAIRSDGQNRRRPFGAKCELLYKATTSSRGPYMNGV